MKIEIEEFKDLTGVSLEDMITEAYELLTARKWEVTRAGIAKNVDVWLENKSDMIRKMVKHPNYNGNLQIVVPAYITRSMNASQANNVLSRIENSLMRSPELFKDKSGKTAYDYLKAFSDTIGKFASPSEIVRHDEVGNVFDSYSSTLASESTYNRYASISSCICDIRYYGAGGRVTDNLAERINCRLNLEKKKVCEGQKSSKVVNRLLHMTNNYDEFNKLFTQYADFVNENKQNGYYVVSLNFLDYLRMSDGNSWSSCHTTDYTNTRHMQNTYSGQYVQGTLSYALDNVSYITYFTDTDTDTKHPDRSWKVCRTMYHVKPDESIYIQGRVYPQDSDGNGEVYNEMQRLWKSVMGYDYILVGRSERYADTTTNGANYKDYDCNSSCMLYRKEGVSDYSISIGHEAYSCYSGNELETYRHQTIV